MVKKKYEENSGGMIGKVFENSLIKKISIVFKNKFCLRTQLQKAIFSVYSL